MPLQATRGQHCNMLSGQEHAWTDRRGHGELREEIVRLEAEIDELTGVVERSWKVRSVCEDGPPCRSNVVTGLHGRGNQLGSGRAHRRDCGRDRGYRRFRVQHEYVEAGCAWYQSCGSAQGRADR